MPFRATFPVTFGSTLLLAQLALVGCSGAASVTPPTAAAQSAKGPTSQSGARKSALQQAAQRVTPGGWRLLPDTIVAQVDELQPDGIRRLMNDGIRVLDLPDGSVRTARLGFRSVGIRSFELPARLGGGVLFSSESGAGSSIWWAQDWLADPKPIASLGEHIESFHAGFDRVYFRSSTSRQIFALDLASKQLVDLAPLPPSSGYGAMLFVDAWFGAVHSDVIGLQATFDGGATWHPLGTKPAETTLRLLDGEIVMTTQGVETALSRTGQQHPVSDASTADGSAGQTEDAQFSAQASPPEERSYALPLGPRPLREAVLYGWPDNSNEAIVATRGALARVRLQDGKLLQLHPDAYPGSAPCPAVSLGRGFGFVCSDKTAGTRVFAFGAPFELQPVAHFEQQRHVTSSGNGLLVVDGACDLHASPNRAGATAKDSQYCVLGGASARRQVRVAGFDPEQRVVALADGAFVVVHPPTTTEAARMSWLEADHVSEKTLTLKSPDATLRRLLTHGTWLDGMTEVEPRVLGGWVAGSSYVGFHLDVEGRLETPGASDQEFGDLERTLLAGPFGFEVSASGIAWQTANYGFVWQKLSAPRSLDPYFTTDPRTKQGPAPTLGCSAVGCVYEPWVRIGYEGDEESVAKGLQQVDVPEALASKSKSYEDWRVQCYPTADKRAIDAGFRRDLLELETQRAKHGAETGYAALPARAPNAQNVTNSSFRPFLGVPSPKGNSQGWLFDMGHERPGEFRAYAWGGRGPDWQQSAAWLVRVATRFGPKPFWSTAPTRVPWPEWVAAQTFGADTTSSSVSDWTLSLDPDENSGVLRIASHRLSAELHWIEDGRTINSVASGDLGRPTSVVRIEAGLMLGVFEPGRFRVYRMTQRDLQEVSSFPIQSDAKVALVRTSDAKRLAVWVSDERGAWYLYPLHADFTPEAPIVVSREQLNHVVPRCSSDAQGWLVRSRPPLNRMQPDELDLLRLATPGARAAEWEAKVLVTSDGVCALEFAANLMRTQRTAHPNETPPPSATLPLTLRDYETGDQLLYRCEPVSGVVGSRALR